LTTSTVSVSMTAGRISRIVTASESSANAASEYRGVYPNRDRWAAAAKFGGRKFHLGTYDTHRKQPRWPPMAPAEPAPVHRP
jgi:hypothetical protein